MRTNFLLQRQIQIANFPYYAIPYTCFMNIFFNLYNGIATQLEQFPIYFYHTLCFHLYRVKRYICNCIGFASENKVITYQPDFIFITTLLIVRCFMTLQVTGVFLCSWNIL